MLISTFPVKEGPRERRPDRNRENPRMHGQFVWYELMTTDTAAATAFYRAVMGWNAEDAGVPDHSYTLLSVGTTHSCGLMALPPEAAAQGARPGWIGYIATADVDATAAHVAERGGAICHQPEDIPGVGRFAVVADPDGAVFGMIRGIQQGEAPPQPARGTPSYCGWRELYAADRERAFAFYAGLFGWTKADAIDMGPMGVYQLFATGDAPVGGMMTRPEGCPRPCWQFYFTVPEIDAAVARVQDAGGRIVNGPHEVPGGEWIVQGLDPQGAMFALVALRRASA